MPPNNSQYSQYYPSFGPFTFYDQDDVVPNTEFDNVAFLAALEELSTAGDLRFRLDYSPSLWSSVGSRQTNAVADWGGPYAVQPPQDFSRQPFVVTPSNIYTGDMSTLSNLAESTLRSNAQGGPYSMSNDAPLLPVSGSFPSPAAVVPPEPRLRDQIQGTDMGFSPVNASEHEPPEPKDFPSAQGMTNASPSPNQSENESARSLVCSYADCTDQVKVFRSGLEWRDHMRKHAPVYRCEEEGCKNLTFSQPGILHRHEVEVHGRHGGPGEHFCPYPFCSRRKGQGQPFKRESNLSDHIRRRHADHEQPAPKRRLGSHGIPIKAGTPEYQDAGDNYPNRTRSQLEDRVRDLEAEVEKLGKIVSSLKLQCS